MNNEERKQRERALREVALNCFTTEKWEDVSVARIAKLAGVAKGTVYLHFASKDEICACPVSYTHLTLPTIYSV